MASPKDVKYDRKEFDDIPERAPRGSVIEDQLGEIEADPSLHNRVFCIAQYLRPTAATAAANVARQRHGKPEANGWWFGTRKVKDDENPEQERTGLFVKFNPSLATEEGARVHEQEKLERKAAAAAKAEAKRAEKGAAGGSDKPAARKGRGDK